MRDSHREATTLIDHVHELRRRIVVILLVLILTGAIIYAFYEPVLALLRSPLKAPLYYTSPAGSFSFVMKICFTGSLAVTIPVIMYNLIMFVQPAFKKALSRRRVYLITGSSALLAAAGAVFGFVCIIPGALRFFSGFQTSGLNALISADSYLSFVTNVIITFVIVFQLPLLIAFIDTLKPLKPQKLLSMEKWVVLGSLIIALLVPFAFDLITTLLVAAPIVVLYNIAIVPVLIRHAYRAHKKHQALQRELMSSSLFPDTVSFESLVEDTDTIENSTSLLASNIASGSTTHYRPGMDIRPSKTRPQPVAPAEWVHHIADPIPLDERAPVISDIQPVRRSSLA